MAGDHGVDPGPLVLLAVQLAQALALGGVLLAHLRDHVVVGAGHLFVRGAGLALQAHQPARGLEIAGVVGQQGFGVLGRLAGQFLALRLLGGGDLVLVDRHHHRQRGVAVDRSTRRVGHAVAQGAIGSGGERVVGHGVVSDAVGIGGAGIVHRGRPVGAGHGVIVGPVRVAGREREGEGARGEGEGNPRIHVALLD